MNAKRWSLVSAAAVCLAGAVQAQPFTPAEPYAGGIDPLPVISSVVTNVNGSVKISWTGFYSSYLVQVSTNAGTSWITVGRISTTSRMISYLCPPSTPKGQWRITPNSRAPRYNSAYGNCGYCHGQIARKWVKTPHAMAFDKLVDVGAEADSDCLPCHTVGYDRATGFTDTSTTPHLTDVQCENCHGPTGGHSGKYSTPAVTLSSTLCGGCHQGSDPDNHSIFQDWETAGHAEVTESVGSYFTNSVLGTAQGRMGNCGFCHSGAVRLALLNKQGALPGGKEASEIGQTCVVCHDPHNQHLENGGYHLRNPMASTNYYNFATSQTGQAPYGNNASLNYWTAYTNFWKQYNPKVQICAQCHNGRGASWTSSSRPLHHSPQYNMLLGNMGVTNSTPVTQSPHGTLVTRQCVQCHMAVDATGLHAEHTFEPGVTAATCGGTSCHADPVGTKDATQADITNRIAQVVGLMRTWGVTKAPASIRTAATQWGTNAWDYSTAGTLSTGNGPNTAGQALIPNDIKQARFNLYYVYHDGSRGVHNADYARYLLGVASNKVQTLLLAP